MKIKHALCLGLALAAALPAQAGLFDDAEARQRIVEMNARIENLQRESASRLEKLEAASRGQIELASQIEALKGEVAKLRGQIEVLVFEMEQTQKRQKDFYVDLDSRLRKLEQPPAPEKPAAPAIDPLAETRDYEAALNLFKGAKYKEAVAAFEAFIKTYAASAFVPSAHYWSGQALYQLRDCKRATEAFNKVSTTWPDDPKAPDALLGAAICQQEAGDAKGARATLETLTGKYPKASAAQAAQDRLKRLKK